MKFWAGSSFIRSVTPSEISLDGKKEGSKSKRKKPSPPRVQNVRWTVTFNPRVYPKLGIHEASKREDGPFDKETRLEHGNGTLEHDSVRVGIWSKFHWLQVHPLHGGTQDHGDA